MHEVEVLAAALAHQPGEAGVLAQVIAHGLPQPLEGSAMGEKVVTFLRPWSQAQDNVHYYSITYDLLQFFTHVPIFTIGRAPLALKREKLYLLLEFVHEVVTFMGQHFYGRRRHK